MKTVCIECRKFEEWDEKVQQKILEKYRDINIDHDDWYEGEFEYWKEELLKMGYEDVDISFRGFWSQGDGASFTGEVNIDKWITYMHLDKYKRIQKLIDNGHLDNRATIKRDRWHHYVHWNTTSIYYNWWAGDNHPNIQQLLDEIEEGILEHHQQLNKDIYNALETTHEGMTSDEAVKDTLIVNEYEFDENGKIL